ncbi:transposase [Roseiarcus sp.]|uniref:transposase n=1 Tax=Roseiarcus sp. TaxID=1969460 RepID=UPI003F9A459F
MAESFEPGANIAAVARRHGVNGGLLHYWRKRARAQALEAAATQAPLFVPVSIAKTSEMGGHEGVPEWLCVISFSPAPRTSSSNCP